MLPRDLLHLPSYVWLTIIHLGLPVYQIGVTSKGHVLKQAEAIAFLTEDEVVQAVAKYLEAHGFRD